MFVFISGMSWVRPPAIASAVGCKYIAMGAINPCEVLCNLNVLQMHMLKHCDVLCNLNVY
jgi:hypothetical protein